MKKKLLAIGGVIVLVMLFLHVRYTQNLRPLDSHNSTGVIIDIPSGSTSSTIGKILEDKHIIRSGSAFAKYTKSFGKANALKAGSFFLKPSMTVPEVVETLVRGLSDQLAITIPEGTTVQDLDELLTAKGMITSGELLNCAKNCDFSKFSFVPTSAPAGSNGGKVEGYLFPDTYFVVHENFTPQLFLERLLTTFKMRVVDGLTADISLSKHSLQEIVTMASLIEEETRGDDERPTVSGILWKRLSIGMRLDVDAAVRYALGKKSDTITSADLEKENPYNLRKVRGLPPGAITNPGLSSINAALHPKESAYFYYLHGSDGQIHYAVTNDQHNDNRARYLR